MKEITQAVITEMITKEPLSMAIYRAGMLHGIHEAHQFLQLQAPDKPGWWAFEGSERTKKRVRKEGGKDIEDHTEEELEELEDDDFENIDALSETFQTIVPVQWVLKGQAIWTEQYSGPHKGGPILGFKSPKYTWYHGLMTPDVWAGDWYFLSLPWENK